MDRRRLPPGHRLARSVLAVALLAAFGAGATVAVATGWSQRLVAGGEQIVQRAHALWDRP